MSQTQPELEIAVSLYSSSSSPYPIEAAALIMAGRISRHILVLIYDSLQDARKKKQKSNMLEWIEKRHFKFFFDWKDIFFINKTK